jgi:hypothetical protein
MPRTLNIHNLVLERSLPYSPSVRGIIDGFDPGTTAFSRASAGTCFNVARFLKSVANDIARFDYDPVTGKFLGLLYEAQSTNHIPNSTMQGASVGALPTNWGSYTGLTGLSLSVVATGSGYGMSYIDLRISGTASAGGDYDLYAHGSTTIAALQNQTWTTSWFSRLVGGSATNIAGIRVGIGESTSAGGYLGLSVGNNVTPTSVLSRLTHTRTLSYATCAYTRGFFRLSVNAAGAVDITLRLYAPQTERASAASSFIPTTTTAVTRAQDQLSFTIPSGVTALRYTFDDNTTQDVAVSAGAYTVPTNLNRSRIRRIQAV